MTDLENNDELLAQSLLGEVLNLPAAERKVAIETAENANAWVKKRVSELLGAHELAAENSESDAATSAVRNAYWSENIRLLTSLMVIWFASSFGAGILFRDFLDQFRLGGYPLGFWFAQQGSIYIFIALIFFYVFRMKAIERKYDLDD